MKRSRRWIDTNDHAVSEAESPRRLSFLNFLVRYPIFLLASGPPLFRTEAVDATKGMTDFWSLLQVGLLSVISIRAIWRLAAAQSIFIPRQIQSILRLALFLGLLFLASAAYSPSGFVSAAYAIFYFLTLICVAEFIVDTYRDPPNWLQCIFHLRLIALLLLVLDLAVLPFHPILVLQTGGETGFRFGGGAVGPVSLICPIIAIVSAYSFLYSLEDRFRSAVLFLVGLAGSLSTQSRGCELALLLSLFILGLTWAKTGKRATYMFITGLIAAALLSGVVVGTVGGGHIWSLFNRGQDAQGIATGSGRTQAWYFVLQYCLTHPQGMGYVAGFRILFKQYYTLGLILDVTHIGTAHNSFVQVLADAGWLAIVIYLIMMMKVVRLGWRFAKRQSYWRSEPDSANHHAIRCALLLLLFCFAEGIDTDQFVVPMRACFYFQNIIVAIILGISATKIVASRER